MALLAVLSYLVEIIVKLHVSNNVYLVGISTYLLSYALHKLKRFPRA